MTIVSVHFSQRREVEEATDDKHVQPGKTETVEEPMVLRNDDVYALETETRKRICGTFNSKWLFKNVFCSYFGHCFCLELDYLND